MDDVLVLCRLLQYVAAVPAPAGGALSSKQDRSAHRQAPGSSTCRSCGPNIYQWPELAALSILFRERLVYSFESRPRLFDIISRSIEGVAGLILGRRRGLAGRCALTRPRTDF
ncbi:hypothetical protein X759_32640 [Mesorhizobium sp. LSHC420B00]|uniref:hypothetical protein n=1 Tax=unclassified Mesorhizobium TaxID=325217 RepID=UPI0003CF4A72|nr:hypothetical protein [Mesorhizobium sp. LSHC420B00]ESX63985.1 hypothetical protein X759_32640 [Mesorhizobium sp. LSHC420B00]